MIMDLIQILKEQHQVILGIFSDIDATSDLENEKTLFKKLMPIAVAHLEKEDTQLYPALKNSSEDDIRQMVEVFSVTMSGYAKELSGIADEIIASQGVLSTEIFGRYEKIRDKIKNRITIEEVTLFPAYEDLMRSQSAAEKAV